jgi:hypothetical protein
VSWTRRFILFFNKRHPQNMGVKEVNEFFAHMASAGTVSAGGKTEAWQALVTLYRDVLGLDLGPVKPPRLLDQMREVLRVQHYALRTEECYVQWVRRFILFHHKRHPLEMGGRAAAGGSSRWQQVERTKPCREALRISRCFNWLTSLP